MRCARPEALWVAALANPAHPPLELAGLPDEVLNRLESARVLYLRGSTED